MIPDRTMTSMLIIACFASATITTMGCLITSITHSCSILATISHPTPGAGTRKAVFVHRVPNASCFAKTRTFVLAWVNLLPTERTSVSFFTEAGIVSFRHEHASLCSFWVTRVRSTRVNITDTMLVFGTGNVARIFGKSKETEVFDARRTVHRIFYKNVVCLIQR